MITFHASETGGADYLDFHTPDGDRLYLPRHEMRRLLEGLLAAVGEDVVCEHCGRLNGVHQVRNEAGRIQWCPGSRAGSPDVCPPQVGAELTSADPEPPPGTTVEMEGGTRWTRYPGMWPGSWLMDEFAPEGDPETWRKVAGNYGPVRIVRTP